MYLKNNAVPLSGFMDFVSSLQNEVAQTWANITGAVSGATSWVGDQAKSGVRNFRNKFAALTAQVQYVGDHPPKTSAPPAQWQEYNTLYATLLDTQNKAQTVDDQIRKLESATGVSLSGLGAIQLLEIPAVLVAGIIAATYLLAKGLDAAQRWRERNQYIDAATAKGQDAVAAMNAYDTKNPPGGGGLFGDASKLVLPAAIIAGLFFLAKGKR